MTLLLNNNLREGSLVTVAQGKAVILFLSKVGVPPVDKLDMDIWAKSDYFFPGNYFLYLGQRGGKHFFLYDNKVHYEYDNVSIDLELTN